MGPILGKTENLGGKTPVTVRTLVSRRSDEMAQGDHAVRDALRPVDVPR